MGNSLRDILGIDPSDPDYVAGSEDAEAYERLIDSLVSIRRDRGLRQADVARAMGTTQSAVSEFERLGGDARYSTLQKYARAVRAKLRTAAYVDEEGLAPGWTTVGSAPHWNVVSSDEESATVRVGLDGAVVAGGEP